MVVLCLALTAQANERWFADMVWQLASANEGKRQEAKKTLLGSDPKRFGVILSAALRLKSELARVRAFRIIRELGSRHANLERHIPSLAKALRDKNQVVRWCVTDLLHKATAKNIRVLDGLFGSKYDDVREGAGSAVARLGPPGIAALHRNLATSSPRRKHAALAGFGQTKDPTHVELILPYLADGSEMLRERAAWSLAELGAKAKVVVPALVRATTNTKFAVLALARFARYDFETLRHDVPQPLLSRVLPLLDQESLTPWFLSFRRKPAAELLNVPLYFYRELPRNGLTTFAEAISSKNAKLAIATCRIAPYLPQSEPIVRAAQSACRSTNYRVRAAAVAAAHWLDVSDEVFLRARKDPVSAVSMEAQFALWDRRGTPPPVELCEQLVKQGDRDAVVRLGQMGVHALPTLKTLVKLGYEGSPEAVTSVGMILSQAPRFDFRSRATQKNPNAMTIARALEWLRTNQEPDGRWDASRFGGFAESDVGVTGLACLALLGEGKVGPHARRALSYLASEQNESGAIGWKHRNILMIQHGIATTALAEAYGIDPNSVSRRVVKEALAYIAMARNPLSAWRYTPRPGTNDTFVTTWMAYALASGHMAGFEVDSASTQAAIKWVTKMSEPNFGRIGYSYPGGQDSRLLMKGKTQSGVGVLKNKATGEIIDTTAQKTACCTAGGLWARVLLTNDRPAIVVKMALESTPRWAPRELAVDHCSWHFGALVAASDGGLRAVSWRKELSTALQRGQMADGTWPSVGIWSTGAGTVFATATGALALQAVTSYPPNFAIDRRAALHKHAYALLRDSFKSKTRGVSSAAAQFSGLLGSAGKPIIKPTK